MTSPVVRVASSQSAATERTNARPLVQVLLNLDRGGLEAVAVDLAVALRGAGFRPVLVALDAGGVHEPVLRREQIEYYVMGGRRLRDPRFTLALVSLFRHLKPLVVHTHHFSPLLHTLAAAKLARVPRLVHTEHSLEYLRSRRDYRIALRLMSRWCDAFVVVGSTQRAFYHSAVGIPERRLRVITNGVDTEVFRPVADRAAARRAAGLPAGVLIGTAGRLFPEKDYGTLVRAMQHVSGADLVFIGDGPERASLEGLTVSLGLTPRVHFVGWRSDVATLLPALDVFVLCSLHEGLPLVVLEAMAAGVPVVATPVGDLPLVVVEGVTGYLVGVGDAAALGSRLRALVQDAALGEALGRAGRHRIEERYSRATMVRSYREAYGV